MTRLCEYDGDWEPWMEGQQAGALRSALRGKRGQKFLQDLIAALDALPVPELAAGSLEHEESGCCCAFGAVRRYRGPENVCWEFDPTDDDIWRVEKDMAVSFDVSETLAFQVIAQNESCDTSNSYSSRRMRWQRVRRWAVANLSGDEP